MGKLREPLNDIYGDNCALPLALEAMGERWSFMILRAAFNGVHHFEEFQQELSIARNILSNRLSRLVDHGIMAREVMAEDRRKVRYELTQKGIELLPAMIALRQWGEKWGAGVASTPVLVDTRDEQPIGPVTMTALRMALACETPVAAPATSPAAALTNLPMMPISALRSRSRRG